MLKAVNRQVLEVNKPDSRYFERILFIVKPEFTSLSASKLYREAEKISGAEHPVPPRTQAYEKRRRQLYGLLGALCAALVAALIALVLK